MDVNLEYLDDVSVFGCDIDDDVLDHGNTGKDDDFDDDARTQTARTQMARDKHLLYEFDWEGSDDYYENTHFLLSSPFSSGFDCRWTRSEHMPMVECHY